MYLQLAENNVREIPVDNPFIYVPAFLFERYGINNPIPGQEGMFIREDWFDSLPDLQWRKIVRELSKYQPSGVSEGEHLQDRASRKQKRQDRKDAKKEKKQEKKDNKAEKKADKQANKTLKKTARQEKRAKNAEGRKQIIDNIGGALGGVLKGVAGAFGGGGGDAEDTPAPTQDPRYDANGNLIKKWYENPVVWVVAGVVVVGGGIAVYQFTKKKPATRAKNDSPSRAA